MQIQTSLNNFYIVLCIFQIKSLFVIMDFTMSSLNKKIISSSPKKGASLALCLQHSAKTTALLDCPGVWKKQVGLRGVVSGIQSLCDLIKEFL